MTHILHIDSSARSQTSVSRELTNDIVTQLGGTSTHRDLAQALPQIDEAWLTANWSDANERTQEQSDLLALSDALIQELKDAQTLVIGAPMYNFSIPASLKAWIDLICRAGITFSYTENGPVGLLEGKRAIIVIATGGVPIGSSMDHLSDYMRTIMGFIGITDVTFIAAEGAASNPDGARAAAKTQIQSLLA
jgi:FMN-dependent NADH-azoreductase